MTLEQRIADLEQREIEAMEIIERLDAQVARLMQWHNALRGRVDGIELARVQPYATGSHGRSWSVNNAR